MSIAASYLYIEVNLLCALICGIILIRCVRSIDKRRKARYFYSMILCFELNFLCDMLWRMIDSHPALIPVYLNYLVNCVYFSAGTLGCYFWFMYAEIVQGGWASRRQRNAWIALLPALVLIGITLASCRTGWVFRIDENNRYSRGPLHLWQLLFSFAYVVITSARALIKAFQKEHFDRRMELYSLASFMLLPLVFVVLQVIFLGQVPAMCVGFTVTLLVVYLSVLDQRITIDPLTQVYNREQMVRYLSHRLRSAGEDCTLFLLMLDADNFKHINDRYGHVEGDFALIRIADVLRRTAPRDAFVGRYGGDEFVIIGNTTGPAQIRELCRQIRLALAQSNQDALAPYQLDVSIGCAIQQPGYTTIPDFISAADAELYKTKREKKHHF